MKFTSGICVDATPTLPLMKSMYDMPLTVGKRYRLKDIGVPDHILVENPDPEIIHEVRTVPRTGEYIPAGISGLKVQDEKPDQMVLVDATYVRTGMTDERNRRPLLVTLDRFRFLE